MDIIEWFKPDVLVDGFHFTKIEPGEELKKYSLFLNSFSTAFYTCHCTGVPQY